jgi:16S rRNA (cytidine1402-2'-O)-methyltransferase
VSGILYLLPNLLHEESDPQEQFVPALNPLVAQLDFLIAESEKEGRRFLRHFERKVLPILLLNEHTRPQDLDELIQPLKEGKRGGLISDAGVPCIADPGAHLVARARKEGIPLQAITGPCSLVLALMLSGLPGQRFSFHGYLAKESHIRKKEIKHYEQLSQKEQSTHICIEAPYRNEALFKELIETLDVGTKLCIASSLLSKEQYVATHTVGEWRKKTLPPIVKKPTIFLFSNLQKNVMGFKT